MFISYKDGCMSLHNLRGIMNETDNLGEKNTNNVTI